MNMNFLGGENATPILDEDDPARRKITLFSRPGVIQLSKCPIQNTHVNAQIEYGFYKGFIEVENPLSMMQAYVCESFIKILEQSDNPSKLIQNILNTDNIS